MTGRVRFLGNFPTTPGKTIKHISQMSANLTKRDIVQSIYGEVKNEYKTLPQKAVRDIVIKTLEHIESALSERRNVELRNFGVFEVQTRKARVGRNPNRPEQDVLIPERTVIKFKAGKRLKSNLQGPKPQR